MTYHETIQAGPRCTECNSTLATHGDVESIAEGLCSRCWTATENIDDDDDEGADPCKGEESEDFFWWGEKAP